MTAQEIKELLQLVKNQNLYCNVELETADTYLFDDTVGYSLCVAHIYADKEKDKTIITMQLDINPKSQTYYLDDISQRFSKDIQKHALVVSDYCKNLITKYM